MVSIKNLYDDLQTLVNQKHYTKTESDEKFLQDLEINVNTDTGKLYIVTEKQASLTLTSSSTEASTGDTITLTATLKDKNNNGISNVRVNFKKGNTIIGSSFTNNNGITTLTYTIVEEDTFTVSASTRYIHSDNLSINVSSLNQIILNVVTDGFDFSSFSNSPFTYTGSVSVDWGDNNTETYTGGQLTHTYTDDGTYTITITGNITSIKAMAFEYCDGLEGVTLPSSVTSIAQYAFSDCTNLTSIDLSNVTSIGQDAFSGCSSLTSIDLSNVTSIGSSAFEYCTGLTSVTIPNAVTSMESYVFANCTNLTSLNVPSNVTSMDSCAFAYCTNLTSVTLNWTTSNSILEYNYEWNYEVAPNFKFIIPTGTTSLYEAKDYPSYELEEASQ